MIYYIILDLEKMKLNLYYLFFFIIKQGISLELNGSYPFCLETNDFYEEDHCKNEFYKLYNTFCELYLNILNNLIEDDFGFILINEQKHYFYK